MGTGNGVTPPRPPPAAKLLRGRRPSGRDIVLAVTLVVLAAGLVQAFGGATSIGITIDEPTHVSRTQGWINDGWYVPTWRLVDGEPDAAADATPYVYGPAFSGLAHAANLVAGNEERTTVSSSEEAWTIRHLIAALIGLATAAAVGLAVWALTSSWRFGLWATAALLAIPLWLGMSFFNPKDVPAASGYTLVTVGLVIALVRAPESRSSRRRAVVIAALVAAGVFLGAGTRVALWAPIAASLVSYGALAWGRTRLGGAARDPLGAGAAAAGFVIGLIAIAVAYPSLFADPLAFVSHSLTDSSNFPWTGFTLTAGELLSEYPPWWYLPIWAFASMPVLLLLLVVAGTAAGALSMARAARGAHDGRLRALVRNRNLALILVVQQALLLSLGSIVTGANMYTGLRQHLYLLPALAILAGVGAHFLWKRSGRSVSAWPRRAAVAILSAALLLPMVEQSLLFPYNYTYVNPIAGLGGVNDRWETDYWWASSREALSRIPAGQPPGCAVSPDAQAPGNEPTPIVNCALAPSLAPYLDERAGGPLEGSAPNAEAGAPSLAIVPKRAGNPLPDGCRSERDVTRWLRGEDVVMSYVVRCEVADTGVPAGTQR